MPILMARLSAGAIYDSNVRTGHVTRYIVQRLIAMPFLVLGIVTLAFLLTTVTKGDPLTAIVGERQMNNPEVVAAAKARWGLDRACPSNT